MKSMPLRTTLADELATEARRRGDGRMPTPVLRCLVSEPARSVEAGGILLSLLGDGDPNVRIGALKLVHECASLFQRRLRSTNLARLRCAVKEACEDRAFNDYPVDDQLAEMDMVRVADVARTTLATLDTVQQPTGDC